VTTCSLPPSHTYIFPSSTSNHLYHLFPFIPAMPLRPGPLQEISLDTLHPHSSAPSTKRHHSPPTSPVKRRILTQEKFQKSSRLSEVLSGPASPVKKLDFGLQLPASQDNSDLSLEFCPPTSSPHHNPRLETPSSKLIDLLPQRRYTFAPREPPPPCSPNSIHYPGFEIHRDTHIPVYEDDGFVQKLASQLARDKDGIKENNPLAMRKKVKKSLVALATSPTSQRGGPRPMGPMFVTPLEQQMMALRT
jgi:hypothetical protein